MDLLKAVQTLSLSKIKEIIDKKGMPLDASYTDYKALSLSIQLGRKDIATHLLNSSCRTNMTFPMFSEPTPEDMCTPLHKAVKLGDVELVKKLLLKNASMTNVDFEGNSPLHLSFILGYKDITKIILNVIERTATYANPKNRYGLSHFHIASTSNDRNVVWGYMKNVTNLSDCVRSDSPFYASYTAMQFAVEFQSPTVLKLLLDHNKGYSQLHVKVALEEAMSRLGNLSLMVELLSNHSQPSLQTKISQFHIACIQDNPALVNSFLDHGISSNSAVIEESGFCSLYLPLHFAIENNCLENVKLLLQYGAQVNICNSEYMTPLHLALYSDNQEIFDLIYKSTINKVIECTDRNGLNYFHVAVASNDISTVEQFLLNKNNDINTAVLHNNRNFSGYTPLHFAVRYGHLTMAMMLIKAGANIEISDMERHGTPLHIAAASGRIALINLLVKNNASITAKRPFDSKNVLHLIVEAYVDDGRNHKLLTYVKKFVLDHGLDVNSKDYEGFTPLHYACMKISAGASCVKVLLECGANINIVNKFRDTPFDVAFYGYYRNNAEDYMVLYNHIKGLQTLGLPVSFKNQECCMKLLKEKAEFQEGVGCLKIGQLSKKQEQRTSEMEKMKKLKVSRKTSIYDFIMRDEKKLYPFVNTHSLTKLIDNATIQKLKNFGYLVKLRLLRLQKMKLTGTLPS